VRFLCRLLGHSWEERRVVGHVHAGDDWSGRTLPDGTPWADERYLACRRCGAINTVHTSARSRRKES